MYFLSDRNGPVSAFAYDPGTRQVTEVVKNQGLDLKSLTAGPDVLAYEQFGSLFLLDPASYRSTPVPVRLSGDLPEVRPRFVKVDKKLGSPALSPNGKRAAFAARGEILTVPAEKGDIRNLTRSPAVADRDPSWSPDGLKLAWLCDESGEYALHVRDQGGLGEVKKIPLGDRPSFFYSPLWSPDGRKIALTDTRLNLWYVDVEKTGPLVRVDTEPWEVPDAVWSPDSRWLAYTKVLPNSFASVFVYSITSGRTTPVTDGMSDARFPAWDRSGKYLFFAASTDLGPVASQGSMAGINRPVSRSVYAIVLKKDLPSPIAPESDEEKPEEKAKKDETPKAGGKPTAEDKEAKGKGEKA